MAAFFVSPLEPGDWRLDPAELRRHLTERWPAADVRGPDTPDDPYPVRWTIPTDGPIPVEGALDAQGNGVTLDGDLPDVAGFARWLATIAGPQAGLHLYDEGYSAAIPVSPDTPLPALTDPFLA